MAERKITGDLKIIVDFELGRGDKPNTIAKRHGICTDTVYKYMRECGIKRRVWMRWTQGEDDLIRRYYPTHGAAWHQWKRLLPGRKPASINKRASDLGVRYVGY